jgi:serine/threonine-protein kinase
MSDQPAAPPGAPPSVVGRYRVTARLASDTIDEIYEGFDPLIERPVVVRLFQLAGLGASDVRAVSELFYTVMRRTGALVDPGLMTIYDVGEMPGALFVASEFVDGTGLDDLLAGDAALDLERRVSILTQLADALEHAREHDVAHLDLTPASVRLGADHSVKIGGFGAATVADAIARAAGVPARRRTRYEAPERSAGAAGDTRADVFSLAEIAVDLFAPHVAREAGAIPPLPADLHRQGVKVDRWAALFAEALRPDPAGRFATPGAFKAAALAVLGIDEGQARLAWDALGPSSLKSVAVDSEAETFLAGPPGPAGARPDETRTGEAAEDDPPTTFRTR